MTFPSIQSVIRRAQLANGPLVLTALGLVAAASVLGFTGLFTSLYWYDDEGYVMISVQGFVRGHALYTDVSTQYGPFFFLYRAVVHTIFNLPVTHDVNRLLTLCEWIAIACLSAVFVRRLTGSTWLGLFGATVVFLFLEVMVKEPGHPQGICAILTLLALVTSTARRESRWWKPAIFILGALVSALVMTKINAGVFLGLAVLLALAFSGDSMRGRSLFCGFLAGSAVVLPALLTWRTLLNSPNRAYAIVATCSVIAALLVAYTGSRTRGVEWRDLVRVTVAGLVTMVGILFFIWLSGSQVDDIIYGLWGQHTRYLKIVLSDHQLPYPVWAVGAGAVGLVLSLLWVRGRHGANPERWRIFLNWLKLAFGVSTLVVVGAGFLVESYEPLGYGGAVRGYATTLLAYGGPFLWLLFVRGAEPLTFNDSFRRLLLCFVAVLHTLLPFPIWGSQIAFGSFFILLAALVAISDAVPVLANAGRPVPLRALQSTRCMAVVWLLLVVALGLRTEFYNRLYQSWEPLRLPGAKYVRLSPDTVEGFQVITKNLQAHADVFFTTPGFNSLYFWTEQDPPSYHLATTWQLLLNRDEQRKVVDALGKHERACVVWDMRYRMWDMIRNLGLESPIADAVHADFHPVGRFRCFEFYVRSGRPTPKLLGPESVGG